MPRALLSVLAACLTFRLVVGSPPADGAEAKPLYKDIRGCVVDARGEPVAEAVVTAMAGVEHQTVLSDADGRFTIPIRANYAAVPFMAAAGDRIGFDRTVGSSRLWQGELRIELRDARALAVKVEDTAGQPAAGARVQVSFDLPPDMAYLELPRAATAADGTATLRLPCEAKCRGVGVHTADGKKGGLVETAADAKQVTVKIQKLVRAKGQFVDRAGRPLYSTQFYYGPLVREHNETAPWLGCFGGHLTCDEDGNFILNDLVVGGRYRIVNAQNHQTATMLAVDQRSPFDAGKVIVRNGTPGPTAEQEIARLCLADPTKAYERAKQEAARRHQRVLVLIVDPQAASTRQLVDFRLRYKDVRLAADNFNMLIVEAAGKQAAPFLRALDLPPTPGEAWTQLVVRTAEGAPVTDAWLPEVSTDGQIDRARLLAWLRAHSPPVPDAQQLLDDALAEARQSGRRVLVLQTAVWCHPSNLLQDYLESQRAVLDQDFVSVQIDERWANIQAAIARIRPKSNGIGLPWLAALDADGHLLSMLQGYPNRETFQDLLQASAQRLSPDEMEALLSALVQKPTVKKSSSIRGTIHPKQAE